MAALLWSLSILLVGTVLGKPSNVDVIPEDYDPSLPPVSSGGSPFFVDTQLYIRDLQVSSSKMEVDTTITVRLNWTDPRLAHSAPEGYPSYYRVTDGQKIWIPDIFFLDERSAHYHIVMKPNTMIHVYPDGLVVYSTRISLTLACAMDFHWFPFDRHTCPIRLSSYGYSNETLSLRWTSVVPVMSRSDLKMPQFRLTGATNITAQGKYPTLIGEVSVVRETASYVWRYFVPTTLLVMVSWVAFWLLPEAVTPRALLSVASLLGIYHLFLGQDSSELMSHHSVFDIWGLSLAVMAVMSLLETATVSYIRHHHFNGIAKSSHVTTHEVLYEHSGPNTPLMMEKNITASRDLPREPRLDVISRIAFPVMFLLFSVIFWAMCL